MHYLPYRWSFGSNDFFFFEFSNLHYLPNRWSFRSNNSFFFNFQTCITYLTDGVLGTTIFLIFKLALPTKQMEFWEQKFSKFHYLPNRWNFEFSNLHFLWNWWSFVCEQSILSSIKYLCPNWCSPGNKQMGFCEHWGLSFQTWIYLALPTILYLLIKWKLNFQTYFHYQT